MNEPVAREMDDLGQPSPDGELVHWMDRKPLSLGPTGVSLTAGAAFTLGVAVTVAVLALTHWLGPQRVAEIPRRQGRGH